MFSEEDGLKMLKYFRFTHTITSLIGNSLRVETQNNIEFEGILKTFSPQLEMVLEWVHQVMKCLKISCFNISSSFRLTPTCQIVLTKKL